jgi:hypothetical protein
MLRKTKWGGRRAHSAYEDSEKYILLVEETKATRPLQRSMSRYKYITKVNLNIKILECVRMDVPV